MKVSILTPTIRPEYLDITYQCLKQQTFQDFEWLVEVGFPDKGFSLSKDLNALLRRSKGEIVVMLQDCIKIEPDAIQSIVEAYDGTLTTYPVGKIQNNNDVKFDWRAVMDLREIDPPHWEADFASGPLKAFFDIGGYDEDYDNGWSWENVEVAWRAKQAGYKFMCNPKIKGIAIDHDVKIDHPFRNKRENNDKRARFTRQMAEQGVWKLSYL